MGTGQGSGGRSPWDGHPRAKPPCRVRRVQRQAVPSPALRGRTRRPSHLHCHHDASCEQQSERTTASRHQARPRARPARRVTAGSGEHGAGPSLAPLRACTPPRCAPHPCTGPQSRKQEIHPERKRGAGGLLAPSGRRDLPPAVPEPALAHRRQPKPTPPAPAPLPRPASPRRAPRGAMLEHLPVPPAAECVHALPLQPTGFRQRERKAAARRQPVVLACSKLADPGMLGEARVRAVQAALPGVLSRSVTEAGERGAWSRESPCHRPRGARRIPAAGHGSGVGHGARCAAAHIAPVQSCSVEGSCQIPRRW